MKTILHALQLAGVACLALLAATAARAADFHVATAQDLQNALTTAAANGADNNIWLTNGYYIGNFNYNSGDNNSLAVQPEPGLTNTDVTIDGGGGGRDFNITCSGSSGNVSVSGLAFIRNCGNYQIGALRIAASSGGTITVDGCRFLSLTNTSGMGLEIAAGLNTTIQNCSVSGKGNVANDDAGDGNGINISGVTGNTLIYSNTMSQNYEGYGAEITASAVLTVTSNVFAANTYGGLSFSPSSGSEIAQVLLTGNVFNGNFGDGASLNNFNTLNLTGNIFAGNNGEGVLIQNGVTAAIVANTFNGNFGGGLATYGNVTNTVTGNTFSGNSSVYWGGGAFLSGGMAATVMGNTFTGNVALAGQSSGTGGGGAYCSSQFILFSNNTFNANQARGGAGGGINIAGYSATSTAILQNTFTGNSCTGNNSGGALYVNGGTPVIMGNTFAQNSSADGGGAIYAAPDGVITISDNLLVNNTQSGAGATGGGIFLVPASNLYMINNTVFGNSSGGGGGGASFQISGLTQLLYVFNNIIWGNTATGSGSDVFLTGSGQQTELLCNDVNGMYGVWTVAQNLTNVDPQFFDPVNGDYHFPGTSPCANAGTNGAPGLPLTDLDGNARTNSVGLVDLGCYEFNTTATHPADTNAAFIISPVEYTAYAAAWKSGQTWTNGPNPIPANYLTRAGYLMTNGGAYYNDGSARPVNWKPTQ